jgi:serine/threonine-protein kinase RsbW
MNLPEDLQRKESTGETLLQAPGHGSYLVHIRAIVADLAGKVGFDEHEIAKIELAVDEACSNVVKHAYAADQKWCWQHRDPEIRLDIRTEGDSLVVEINDHGQRFDFTNGYGIPIMRRFMDEVQYSSNDQTGNTLRLVKYLKKT